MTTFLIVTAIILSFFAASCVGIAIMLKKTPKEVKL